MFNLLFISIFALFTNNVLNGAENKEISRVKEHKRQLAQQSKDDFCITPIPPKIHSRKSVISLPYSISPITTEDNLSTQDNLLRRSAPVLNNSPQIVHDTLSTKSLSDSNVNTSKNDDKKKKKSGYSPLKIRHKKKLSPTPLAPIAEKAEHGLLTGARDLRIDLVKFYLSINTFNPNKPRDQFGNTAFHIIAAKKNKLHSSTEENVEEKMRTATAIIDLFLKDYRTDFSIMNNAGSTPRELLSSDQDTILRAIFFSRCSLNIFVNKYAEKLKNAFSRGFISPEVIEGTIQKIIGKLKDIEESQQKDRSLPTESRFSANTTMYFMEQMLLSRLGYITNDN